MAEPRSQPPFSIEHEEDAEETNTIEVTVKSAPKGVSRGQSLLIADLGWTIDEAADTRARLRAFADEWDAAEMSPYDDL
jgi:hypothetical protein